MFVLIYGCTPIFFSSFFFSWPLGRNRRGGEKFDINGERDARRVQPYLSRSLVAVAIGNGERPATVRTLPPPLLPLRSWRHPTNLGSVRAQGAELSSFHLNPPSLKSPSSPVPPSDLLPPTRHSRTPLSPCAWRHIHNNPPISIDPPRADSADTALRRHVQQQVHVAYRLTPAVHPDHVVLAFPLPLPLPRAAHAPPRTPFPHEPAQIVPSLTLRARRRLPRRTPFFKLPDCRSVVLARRFGLSRPQRRRHGQNPIPPLPRLDRAEQPRPLEERGVQVDGGGEVGEERGYARFEVRGEGGCGRGWEDVMGLGWCCCFAGVLSSVGSVGSG